MTRMGRWRRKERIPSAEGDHELEHHMNAISRSPAQPKENQQSNRKQPRQYNPHHGERLSTAAKSRQELNGEQEEDAEAAGEKSSHKSCKKTDESDFHRLLFIRSSQFRYNWLPVMIYNSHLKRVEPVATRTT